MAGEFAVADRIELTALQRAGAAFTGAVTDEGLLSQEYLEEATAGSSLIAVRASEPPLAEEAHRVLAALT
jgi:hypothetical protein